MQSRTQVILLQLAIIVILTGTFLKDRELKSTQSQVAELQVSVQAEQDTITKMTADVNDLGTQITSRESAIIELRKKLADTETELGTTKEELEKTAKKLKDTEKRLQSKPVEVGSTRTLTGFEVTWYNGAGTTKSGAQTRDGVTVSVDPKLIPLGTWLEIVMPDGTVMKRKAEDTGSAVKGKVLDVYASASRSELLTRGRTHNVTVRILS